MGLFYCIAPLEFSRNKNCIMSYWLFLFLLVPILVHLFAFRRVTKYYFSTLRFIREASHVAKSRTRLKHYLILVNRFVLFSAILFLLYLVIVFDQYFYWNRIDQSNVFFDTSPSQYVEINGISGLDEGNQLIADLNIDDGSIDTQIMLREALMDTHYPVVLSDFQNVEEVSLFELKSDTTIRKSLFILGDLSSQLNVYIDTVFVERNSTDRNSKTIIVKPQISGVSNEGGSIVFKLLIGDRQVASVSKRISELGTLKFDVISDLYGDLIVEIIGDNVLYDNRFYFCLSKQERPKISIIGSGDFGVLSAVFGNRNLFDLNVFQEHSIDYEIMNRSDILILNSLDRFPEGFKPFIHDRSLFIFPSYNTSNWSQYLGLDLVKTSRKSAIELDLDFRNPLFKGVFSEYSKNGDAPNSIPVFQMDGVFETLISYRDKSPFLVRLINSNSYFFNGFISPESSTIASHSLFLPIMYQLAFSVTNYENELFFYPSNLLEIDVDNKELPPRLVSESIELIPPFNPSGDGLSVKIPDIEPGFYEIVHADNRFPIAINLPKEESLMKAPTKDELVDFFSDVDHIQVLSSEDSLDSRENAVFGLWKYALLLVLLSICSETLLHRFLK